MPMQCFSFFLSFDGLGFFSGSIRTPFWEHWAGQDMTLEGDGIGMERHSGVSLSFVHGLLDQAAHTTGWSRMDWTGWDGSSLL
jgi:hypothetical protein